MYLSTLAYALTFGQLAHAWVSKGCNNPTPYSQLGLDSNGQANRTVSGGRTYLLHVPKEYDGNTALSLVLSFHGAGGTSAKQQTLSQLSLPSLRINQLPVVAAYPQGADNTAENRTGVWYSAPYNNKTVDDVQFTKDILTDLSNLLCLNPHRYYATGKSNGGGFTAYLACRNDTSTLFAAFAPVSPALYPESLAFDISQCAIARPGGVPIINSHGEQDQTIPYLGRNDSATGKYGVGTSTVNVPAWRSAWALQNGCKSGDPDVTVMYYNGTTVQKWTATQGCTSELIAYTTSYLGHSWPTTLGLDASGAPNNTALFNFTNPAIETFFTENYLPESLVALNWS